MGFAMSEAVGSQDPTNYTSDSVQYAKPYLAPANLNDLMNGDQTKRSNGDPQTDEFARKQSLQKTNPHQLEKGPVREG